MRHKNKLAALALMGLAFALAGCSGSGGVKNEGAQPVGPSNSGISTSGLGNENAGGGQNVYGAADLAKHSVYFDFDKTDIKPDSQSVIDNWARYLSANPTAKVRLEGNCDERGTREYNIGLGERRANAVAQALEAKGVSSQQLSVISYGKERPVCTEHDESCWWQNRRVDLVRQ
ncbi:MAG: peptidoglycan-associated lipoprotein Pal [Sinobacteraceae bacterium]|nr:peptidoglycan-associated lipoprotein Pal [Nevskiaceae bacterium]